MITIDVTERVADVTDRVEGAKKRLAELREHWSRAHVEGNLRFGLRTLRETGIDFCRVDAHSKSGLRVVNSPWMDLLAMLLNGNLSESIAPCASLDSEIAPLSIAEINWPSIEHARWIELERAGLRRIVAIQLRAGIYDDTCRAPQSLVEESAVTLAAHCASGSLVERSREANRLVVEAILGDALAKANGSRTRAGEILKVSPGRVVGLLKNYPKLAELWPAGPRGPKPGAKAKRK